MSQRRVVAGSGAETLLSFEAASVVSLEAKEPRSMEHFRKGREAMAMFEGPDRSRNIMIAVAVVVVAVIIFLYAAGYLSGII
jgi:beta-lactamase regulating signal transducer with metallopeptidase domain